MTFNQNIGRVRPGAILSTVAILFSVHVDAAEPIGPSNVDQLRLLSETTRPAQRVERGPGASQLLLHLDDRIEIVDDTTLEVVRRIADEPLESFSYSRDRSKTCWIEEDVAVVRDEKSGTMVRIPVGEHPGRPVLSPDNEILVVGNSVIDETGGEGAGRALLHVFNATTGNPIRKLTIVDGAYGGLTAVFSPDGRTLAVGNRNYRTNLFDTATWIRRHELRRSMTHEIAFSPDGTKLAAGYVDGTIAIWSVAKGELLRTVDSGCSRVQSLDWSPSGDLLATSGPRGTRTGSRPRTMPGRVQLWDPNTLRLVRELASVKQSGSIRFTGDGERLVARFRRDVIAAPTSIAVWSTSEQK